MGSAPLAACRDWPPASQLPLPSPNPAEYNTGDQSRDPAAVIQLIEQWLAFMHWS